MIRLYMDENVRGAITRGLRRRGVDVVTVQEDGRSSADDPVVLDRAIELARVLFTEDDDLLAEAVRRQQVGQSFPGVIFAHQPAVSIGTCVNDLELVARAGKPEEFVSTVYFIPL
jgi:hypothetical protein